MAYPCDYECSFVNKYRQPDHWIFANTPRTCQHDDSVVEVQRTRKVSKDMLFVKIIDHCRDSESSIEFTPHMPPTLSTIAELVAAASGSSRVSGAVVPTTLTATPPVYKTFMDKGSQLAKYLKNNEEAGKNQKSDFDSFVLVAIWGWVDETDPSQRMRDLSTAASLGDIVQETKGIRLTWVNTRAYPHGGKDFNYRATGAMYHNIFWPTLGVIVAVWNESPDTKVRMKTCPSPRKDKLHVWHPDKDKIPDLKHWSDIVYLSWKNECRKASSDMGHLRYVYQRFIFNPDTLCILGYVLRDRYPFYQARWRAPKWPEKEVFKPDQHGFHALLSTPNVRGIAWLLIQHRRDFPDKLICSITVYDENEVIESDEANDTKKYQPTLLIEIR